MQDQFAGKQVVVTGGAGALGAAVVAMLVERGAECHVPAFDERELSRFALRDHARVRAQVVGDLSDEGVVGRFFAGIPGVFASVHIAGGFAWSPIEQTTGATLRGQIGMNLISCYLCCREAVKAMRASGAGGRVVNVAARPALEPRLGANMTAYTASKAGVVGLTCALAEEVAKDGILVNAVAPSVMDTVANRLAMPDADHASWPKVDDVARTIVWLASVENTVTRGGVVPVYGNA